LSFCPLRLLITVERVDLVKASKNWPAFLSKEGISLYQTINFFHLQSYEQNLLQVSNLLCQNSKVLLITLPISFLVSEFRIRLQFIHPVKQDVQTLKQLKLDLVFLGVPQTIATE